MNKGIWRRLGPGLCALAGLGGVALLATMARCSEPPVVQISEIVETPGDGSATSTTTPPGSELGNTFEGFGAANWSLGKYPDFKYAMAFVPRAGKAVTSMWICWKTAPGYGAGTYGVWTFELQSDNPRGHVPSGQVLARIADVRNLPEGYLKLDFPQVPLTAGRVYHLVAYNTDPDLEANWSSPNTIMSLPDNPWRGEGVLSFDGRGWREWGPKDNRCAPYRGSKAAYLLAYADGTFEGMPYYFAYEHRIFGNVYQGETILWSRPTVQIRQVGFAVYAVGHPTADLHFVLEDAKGTQLAAGIAARATSITELPTWQRTTLDEPVTLTKGQTYRLYLKAPGCTREAAYATYVVYATAAVKGWAEQTWGGTASACVTFDGTWQPTKTPADLTFSLISD